MHVVLLLSPRVHASPPRTQFHHPHRLRSPTRSLMPASWPLVAIPLNMRTISNKTPQVPLTPWPYRHRFGEKSKSTQQSRPREEPAPADPNPIAARPSPRTAQAPPPATTATTWQPSHQPLHQASCPRRRRVLREPRGLPLPRRRRLGMQNPLAATIRRARRWSVPAGLPSPAPAGSVAAAGTRWRSRYRPIPAPPRSLMARHQTRRMAPPPPRRRTPATRP